MFFLFFLFLPLLGSLVFFSFSLDLLTSTKKNSHQEKHHVFVCPVLNESNTAKRIPVRTQENGKRRGTTLAAARPYSNASRIKVPTFGCEDDEDEVAADLAAEAEAELELITTPLSVAAAAPPASPLPLLEARLLCLISDD